jgi:sterol desaturase/sphingolipid hydroxylase (fatty acid hydroxylase superfamily)
MLEAHRLDPTVWAIPAFFVLMIAEGLIIGRFRAARGYERRDTAASLTMGIVNVLITAAVKSGVFVLFAGLYALTPLRWSASSPWTWIALLLVTDFLYYWFHRIHHEVRFFWAAHVNHHSSRYYNLSTALRQSWMTPLTGVPFYAPLALLGFSPAMIVVAVASNTLYQFWIHTESIDRLGPLEWIINTPSHHRVHHGRNVEYLDKNYAGMLIVWDRMFGTFEPEHAPVDYGLTKNIHTFNPIRIAFHEYVDMLRDAWHAGSFADAWRHVVRAPGWSPDGSTLTAAQMQARLARGLSAAPEPAAQAASDALAV